MKLGRVVSSVYTEMSQIACGVVLLFVAVNVGVWLWVDEPVGVLWRYGEEMVLAAYPGRDPDEVRALVRESWLRPLEYAPFVQYREPPFEGTYLNVSPAGFRHSLDQGPWPPAPENLNVFLFGGSTLFGYGVADGETVASYVQTTLASELPGLHVSCYNFGAGSYYSSMERTKLAELLVAGFVPDVAIFLDGINEFNYEVPLYTRRLTGLLEGSPRGVLGWAVTLLPATKLALRYANQARQLEQDVVVDPAFDDPPKLDAAIERYLANQRLIEAMAAGYGMIPFFVLQPSPAYQYDTRYHPFAAVQGLGANSASGYGYARLAERLREKPPSPNLYFYWAADLQRDLKEPLYVDVVHYSPRLNQIVAESLVEEMVRRSLLDRVTKSHSKTAKR